MSVTLHIDALFAGAAHAVGFTSNDPADNWQHAALAAGLPEAKRAVVVLIDGMGFAQLEHYRGHIPFLRRYLHTTALTTFPSTTACAITSFATGYPPGKTGMAGFTLKDPHRGHRLQLLSFLAGDSMRPNAHGRVQTTPADPRCWQPHPPIAARCEHQGRICSVGPAKFAGTGLTLAAWRGIRQVFAGDLSERVECALQQLRTDATLVYLYWEALDHAGHKFGWNSPQWVAEVENVDRQLARLASRLPAETLLVITADHGMVDITNRIDLADFPGAAQWESAGEERALHVYFPADIDHDEAAADLAAWVGERGQVIGRDEMDRLMGGIDPAIAARFGDVMIAAHDQWGISDRRWMSAAQRSLIGAHGSISAAERTIPVMVLAN
ncbi:MAG: alkaline phosphatase family protein [Bowdeniella nasicola]|nr:alkaline phosphatase family protein [Bowdeniella nasicola]